MSPEEEKVIRDRQRSRAIMMGLLLGAFVILIFAITIVKMELAT
ncbi:MAG: hypothetical protein RLN87_10410 [Parasphingopyxis sp.]